MIWEKISLPLLTKELIEQAQNQRTYILRVVYAVVLYGAALYQYADLSNGGDTAGLMNLGKGRGFFSALVTVQAISIMFLMPAISCGAVAVEKEKDTLALLLLTKLSTRTIIFEKLLSRVFAVGTYQLLSLPLFAIIYGMGGVELSDLIVAIGSLLCLTIVVGSISILCSTWFRTTAEAFIMTYVVLLIGSSCLSGAMLPVRNSQLGGNPQLSLAFATITLIVNAMGTFIVSMGCLLMASNILVARAFVPPRNILLELFQKADRFFNELNKNTTGGIVLVHDRQTLPLFDPIGWRETGKKSLGTFRYQFRILMLLLAPLILVISALITDGRNDFTRPFRGFPAFFWFVSIICITIHSTGAIPSERIRQSLDVLLVIPMTPKEIVLAKLSGVRRLIKILTVPFAVLVIFQAIWTGYVLQNSAFNQSRDFWLEIMTTSLAAIIYMPVTMWVGFQFGTRLKTQIQAVLATMATIVAVCVVPIALARWLSTSQHPQFAVLQWLSPLQVVFSSAVFVASNPNSNGPTIWMWIAVCMHFGCFVLIWWLLRRNAIATFSEIVGRTEASPDRESLPDTTDVASKAQPTTI